MLFFGRNMKFSSREDIEASAEAVFAALCDQAEFEQQMRRSGVSVVRMDELSEIGPGMSWEIDFKFRGREHKFFHRSRSSNRSSQCSFQTNQMGFREMWS